MLLNRHAVEHPAEHSNPVCDSWCAISMRLQQQLLPGCHWASAQQGRCIRAAARAARSSARSQDSVEDGDLPPASRMILEKKDISINELASKVRDNELDLQPSYQRGLVWDRKRASRLVVTALEQRVVPAVYLEEDESGNLSIMDGKQRLASLISFLSGSNELGGLNWQQAPTMLEVTDDTICDIRWHGTTFASLPPDRQRCFKNYSIMCVIVKSETDRSEVFNIYQDINMGSVGHTHQQSRKAAYHGPYMDLLDELSGNEDFLKIQRRSEPDNEKEYDRELALRFFALAHGAKQFKTPMKHFLNKEAEQRRHADPQQLAHMRQMFKETTATVWQIWGEQACRDPAAKSKGVQLSEPLWDAVMVAVWEELQLSTRRRKELISSAAAVKEQFQVLLQDKEFKASLVSTSKEKVVRRIDMTRRMLQDAAPSSLDAKRGFSISNKQQLWTQASMTGSVVCALCLQVIHTESDAEVDHIKPWSHGGRTDLTNAQLVHRFCNRYKGNRVDTT